MSAISLWLELIPRWRQPDTWQTGDIWILDDVPWPSVPREGDVIEIGRDDEGRGVSKLVEWVFWRDDGSVDVHLGQLLMRDITLAKAEAMLRSKGWHKEEHDEGGEA